MIDDVSAVALRLPFLMRRCVGRDVTVAVIITHCCRFHGVLLSELLDT